MNDKTTAAERIMRDRTQPLTAVEKAFFGRPDHMVKPASAGRVPLGDAVSAGAVRELLNKTCYSNEEVEQGLQFVRDRSVNLDIKVEPAVRERLRKVLMNDARFNGAHGNGIGYSEFITRALDALNCED